MSGEENRKAMNKAYEYMKNIRKNLQADNRFFTDDKFLECLGMIFRESEVDISEGTIFYRARTFDRNDIDESKLGTAFEGYTADRSFVNKSTKWSTFGRMNPQGISVLYVATDISTAITELHPYYEELFSVATIRAKDNLKVVDLSKSSSAIDDDFVRNVAIYVQEWVSGGNIEKDYVFPQYIASYCKHMGYDGIGYRSKYAARLKVRGGDGINYTIFNYDKCEVTGSKLYEINGVEVGIEKFEEHS